MWPGSRRARLGLSRRSPTEAEDTRVLSLPLYRRISEASSPSADSSPSGARLGDTRVLGRRLAEQLSFCRELCQPSDKDAMPFSCLNKSVILAIKNGISVSAG